MMSQNTPACVISIQSMVSYGYVGNSMFNFAMQLHGIDTISIPTVMYSSHAEQNVYYGQKISAALFTDLLKGTRETQVDLQAPFVVSGYINSPDILALTQEYIQTYKKVQPTGKYIYDPVFGDKRAHGLYIDAQVADRSLELLLPLCDIITPNHFEIEYILKQSISCFEQLAQAIEQHELLRDKTLIVTDACFEDTPKDTIEVVVWHKGELSRLTTPKVALAAVGTGDLFTAILCACLCQNKAVEQGVEIAMRFIGITLNQTIALGRKQIGAQAVLYAKAQIDTP